MITMREENLHDQAGMTRALQEYFQDLAQGPEALNTMLDAAPVSCDFAERTFTLQAQLKPWMANPNGILHGGVTAAYLDFVMGLICRYFSGGRITPTLHMDVSYLRSGKIHDTIYIEAEIVKPGSSVCYAASRIYPKDNPTKPIATATGTYFVIQT